MKGKQTLYRIMGFKIMIILIPFTGKKENIHPGTNYSYNCLFSK